MATTIEEVWRPGDGPPDPFRYGWRYVRHVRPDGGEEFEQVPLSLEDVLHPQEGDQVTHSNEHQRHRRHLCDVFEGQLRHEPTAVVLDDVRIAWDIPELGAHGPDIAVILGVRQPKRNWSTFDVAREGVRPAMLVEITSPETAGIERSTKVDEYELARVPLYVIVDMVSRRREATIRLRAYTLTAIGYEMVAPNERGWIWLPPVRAWLGVSENELACYDESGRRLGDFLVQLERAETAEAREREQAARAANAEARVRELEAQLLRLSAGAE